MDKTTGRYRALVYILALAIFMIGGSVFAKDDKISPKEAGVYVKTNKGLNRLLPNIVFTNDDRIFYIESNNPAHFLLKDVEYFVFFGKYEFKVLTLNPMVFFQASPIGRPSFMFGKDIDFEIKQTGTDLYTVKPKGLLGRGYYSLWINDVVWDFVLD